MKILIFIVTLISVFDVRKYVEIILSVVGNPKGRKTYSFEYNADWINSQEQMLLDPDIAWYKGRQYPNGKDNFDVFLDSMPDTWGRITNTDEKAQCHL